MFSVSVARNGPGLLVSWPPVPGATGYAVSRARKESLSFFPLESSCCPVQPNFERPCCPVAPSRHSLQVEGLEPGMAYRFRVSAIGTGNESHASAPVVSAAVPGAPDAPEVVVDDASVVDMRWAAGGDGGSAILGYRIVANLRTASYSADVELIGNSSTARAAVDALALLPSSVYDLAVHALNAVGVGPASPVAAHTTAPAPAAAYELPVGRWAAATLLRGQERRHRFFVPTASTACGVRVQLRALGARALLQVRRGAEPVRRLPEDEPLAAEAGAWNASSARGELSLRLAYPASDWYYLLLHAAAAAPASLGLDVRVWCASAAETVAAALDIEARHGVLEEPWRYAVDPEGQSEYSPWVLERHMHPLSEHAV